LSAINLDTLTVSYSDETLTSQPNEQLILVNTLLLDQNPAAVYLAKMKKSSRRPQKSGLDAVARILSNGRAD